MNILDGWELDEFAKNFNEDTDSFFLKLETADELLRFAEWRREQSQKEDVPLLSITPSGSTLAFVVLTPNHPSVAPLNVPLSSYTQIFAYGRSTFFNESAWFNEGIKFALAQDSKWIVLMSDDLYEVSPIGDLSEHLSRLDNKETDVVWIDPRYDYYHSYEAYLAKRHPLESVLGRDHLKLAKLYEKFGVETVVASETPIRKPFHYWAFTKMFPRPYVGPSFRMTSDFCILSAEWCRKQGPEVLNELFVGFEDCDLSMRLRNARSTTLDWRIGSQIGGTLEIGMKKALLELFNLSIFNSLLREGRYGDF